MKGIMFKPDMIKAIRELRKSQTRRLDGLKEINREPDKWHLADFYQATGGNNKWWAWFSKDGNEGKPHTIMPRYQPNETVYIKEAWAIAAWTKNKVIDILYQNGDVRVCLPWNEWCAKEWDKPNWDRRRSPMFMPEWAARDFIKITDVRPESLQDITEDDVIAEGILPDNDEIQRALDSLPNTGGIVHTVKPIKERFINLWDSINAKNGYAYENNNWVWKYVFERAE